MKGKYSPYPGDKEQAVLEQGEYVLNRNAVNAIGKDKLDELNYEQEPRFLDQNEHRMRHAGTMAQRGGQKLSPQEIAAMQRSQGQGNVQPKQSEFNQYISNVFDPEDPNKDWVARAGRDISKDPQYSKWLEIHMDMNAAEAASNMSGGGDWTMFIPEKRRADARKSMAKGPQAYFQGRMKDSGIGMEKFMKMRHDADNWTNASDYYDGFLKNEKNIRRDEWAKKIEKREYADKKMDEWRAMQATRFKLVHDKNKLAQASKNASEERNLVNREQQLAHIDKLKAQSDKKWGQMGLPGWEDDAPKKAIYSAISNKPENFGAYLESTMGSKDKPLSRYDAIGRAEGMKEMIHKQAVEMFGDENYSAATESERKDIENAQLAIEESKHFALRGYRSPSEVEEDAAKERMIAKAIEPIQKQDSKMKEATGGLKSALSSFAGSLLYGQSGGYVQPRGYLLGGLAAGSMAAGGLGRLAAGFKNKGGFKGMAENFKAGLGEMKEKAGQTDYHMNQEAADAAQMKDDLSQYGGDIDWDADLDERNKLSNKGQADWMTKEDLQKEWYDDTKDWRDDRTGQDHQVNKGRAIAEGINEKISPIASAAAKLGGEGIGMVAGAAGAGLQAAGKGISQVAGAAKKDWAKGQDSKLKQGIGFLSAMGQEAIAPGYIHSQMNKDRPDLKDPTGKKLYGGEDMTLEQMQAAIPGYDASKAHINATDDEDYQEWLSQGDGSVVQSTQTQSPVEEQTSNYNPDPENPLKIGESGHNKDSLMNRLLGTGRSIYNFFNPEEQTVNQQRGGFISGVGHYQDGGYVSPHNNSRRLMNQARRRYV